MWRKYRGLSRRRETARARRSSRGAVRLALDFLESRTLLSNVTWTGAADGKSWTVAGNWSDDALPTSSDDVTINLGGNPTIQITSGAQTVHSLTSTDALSISGGSLSVAANSSMSGGLTMTGGSLIANGAGITLSVTGTATVSGGGMEAEGGATLSLSQLTTYAGAVNATSALEATGIGSVLSLPNLATVTEDTGSFFSRTQILALSGGDVELPALTSIGGGPVQLESDGAGSKLNINALTSFSGNTGQQNDSGLQVTNHASVTDTALTTLNEANLTLDGTGTLSTGQIATFTTATLTLSGGTATFSGLTNANASSFLVSGGAVLTLSDLSTYAGPVNATATWQATGTGSKLAMSKLATLTEDTGGYTSRTLIQALSGGDVELPALTSISGGPVQLESDGAGSVLNINALTSFSGNTGQQNFSGLQVTNHASASDTALATLNEANLTLDGTGTLSTGQIATFTTATLTLSGGTATLAGLTNANASSFLVSGGAVLTLSDLSTYAGPVNATATWQATGTGSKLAMSKLATLTEDTGGYTSRTLIQALSGGDVELPALTSISSGPVQLESDGAGSVLNINALSSFSGNTGQQNFSGLQVTNHASASDTALATLNEANLTLDGTGTLSTGQIATFTTATLTLSGGTATLAGLTNANASSFLVSGGAVLTLSDLSTYAGPVNATATWQATGTGSKLAMSKLATLTEDTGGYTSRTLIQALSGGDVELPALTSISGGPVQLESDGAGSVLNINALTSFSGNTGQQNFSGLQVTNHASASDAALATLNEANLTLDGTGTLSTGQIATFTAATLTLSGGTATLAGLTNANASSFLVSGGAVLTLSDLSTYAGPVNATATWQATGTGSKLAMTKLATVTEDTGGYISRTVIQVLSGGDVELPALATISGGPVQLESDGAGSKLNINALTSLSGNTGQQNYSGLQVTDSGTVEDQALATFSKANLTLDGTGTLGISQIKTFTVGTISLSGGTANFSGITDADGSSLEASGGMLTLSTLKTYAGGVNDTSVLQATGTGSLLALPALTTMTEDTGGYTSRTQVQALSGGDVELPLLASISGGPVQLESDGAEQHAQHQCPHQFLRQHRASLLLGSPGVQSRLGQR